MPENAQVIITPTTLPEGACYTTEQERLIGFAEAMTGQLPGNYGTINIGSDAPAADDRVNPWVRSNVDGSPDGTYIYFDGTWKRKHPLDPGLIMMWAGTAGGVDTLDGGVAGAATINSGPFWEIVTAMAAKFPVGVGTFASGTAVAVTGTGGEDRHTLVTAELPAVLGQFPANTEGVLLNLTAGGANGIVAGPGTWKKSDLADLVTGGNPLISDKSHQNLPPYFGIFYVRRSVRIYYSI
jgi:hypothetical protein